MVFFAFRNFSLIYFLVWSLVMYPFHWSFSLFFKLEADQVNMDNPPWGQFAPYLYYSLQLVAHALMYHDYIPFFFALPLYTPPCFALLDYTPTCFAHPHCIPPCLAFLYFLATHWCCHELNS